MAISFTTVCARPRDSKRWSKRLLELKQSQTSEDRQWNRREPRDIDGVGRGHNPGGGLLTSGGASQSTSSPSRYGATLNRLRSLDWQVLRRIGSLKHGF